MNYYLEAFKKYAEFNGRTSRKGFWMFVLFNIIASIVISIIDGVFNLKYYNGNQGFLSSIYNLVLIIPSFAIAIRRMHDINHSGWWILFPIVNLIMSLQKGTIGENKYGPAPIEPTVGPMTTSAQPTTPVTPAAEKESPKQDTENKI